MLFSKRVDEIVRVKQKKRTFKKFKFFYNLKKFFKIKSLSTYRLFINNIKLVNFFLRKCVSKFRRSSRKEFYKKLKEKDNKVKKRIKGDKQLLKRFSFNRILKKSNKKKNLNKKIFFLNKYRRIHNSYICFNSKKLPFTKKSTNSRMGKGKGKLKNWFMRIRSGKILFYLLRWNSNYSLYALKTIEMYLPGKNISITPFFKKIKFYFYKKSFII